MIFIWSLYIWFKVNKMYYKMYQELWNEIHMQVKCIKLLSNLNIV